MIFPHLTNSSGQDLDQVQLTGMLMSCVIGIFPNERHRKQPVTIDLCLYLNTRKAAASTHIHDTIDYAAAVKEISFILEQCEFLLIESAVDTVCRYFLTTYAPDNHLPQVDAVVVRISKPSALTHGIVPAIQIQRKRDELMFNSKADANQTITIHQSPCTHLRLCRVPPGGTIRISPAPEDYRAALTIGKLHSNNELIKPRTYAISESNQSQSVTLINQQISDQLVLVVN